MPDQFRPVRKKTLGWMFKSPDPRRILGRQLTRVKSAFHHRRPKAAGETAPGAGRRMPAQ
jgi:hypothetical protein